MDTFINGLQKMLLRLEVVSLEHNPHAVLVFAVGCAIVGVAAVFLDLAFFTLRGQSLLRLKHGRATMFFLIEWAFGSFVMGYIGQLAKVFQVSLLACVLVGFTWPLLFTELLDKLRRQENEEEPEQILTEEV